MGPVNSPDEGSGPVPSQLWRTHAGHSGQRSSAVLKAQHAPSLQRKACRSGWDADIRVFCAAQLQRQLRRSCAAAGRRRSCLEGGAARGRRRDAGDVGAVDQIDGRRVVGDAARAVRIGREGVVAEGDAVDVEDLHRRVGDFPVRLPRVVVFRAAEQCITHRSASQGMEPRNLAEITGK